MIVVEYIQRNKIRDDQSPTDIEFSHEVKTAVFSNEVTLVEWLSIHGGHYQILPGKILTNCDLYFFDGSK